MLKSELIERLAKKFDQISIQHIEQYVSVLLSVMSHALARQERIELRGFGSFTLRYYPPRNSYNPKTGKRQVATAKYKPHFKPGKALKNRVNKL